MVISRLNLNRIDENLDLIAALLQKLRRVSGLSIKEFLSDERNPAATESFLRRCLEAIFDIGRHILAKSYSFKSLEYKEVAVEMGKKGIVSGEYSDILLKMAGYRNRMVHFYKEISDEELHSIVTKDLHDIEKFLIEIQNFLEKYKKAQKMNSGK